MCSGRVLRSGCCLARFLGFCVQRLPCSQVVLLGVLVVLRRGLPSVRCSCRWFSMLDLSRIVTNPVWVNAGGYVVSENSDVAVHVSFWWHSSAYFWFYSEKVKVEAWNFFCFKHVCAEFHLDSTFLDSKTFGAVIKFCINSQIMVAKRKMMLGDCL